MKTKEREREREKEGQSSGFCLRLVATPAERAIELDDVLTRGAKGKTDRENGDFKKQEDEVK